MMNTETTCEGFRCEDAATDTRVKMTGETRHFCEWHARNFDAVKARGEVTPELLAEMRAERELEGRVS